MGIRTAQWEIRVASGGWKRIRNYHAQALGAAYAVRDAMGRFARQHVEYPRAALVFVPAIPPASEIPGSDFKVCVAGLDEMEPLLAATKEGHWPLHQWRSFAARHRLTRVGQVAAAFDARLAEAEDLIDRYLLSFRRTYGPLATGLVSFGCEFEGEAVSSDRLADEGAAGASLLLHGPSGCGKTLLGYRIAVGSIDRGRVPILIRAQDFRGNLRDAVHREAGLLDTPSAEALVSACRRLDRPISLIIDGYNECVAEERSCLTRSIGAAARRYEASVTITTQTTPERAELLYLRDVSVLPPNSGTKSTIARHAARAPSLDPALQPLINSIESGLEARLVGEAGRAISPQASRFAIFDTFVRKKLGDAARDGITALTRVAQLLTDRVSFSLSVRDLDRLAAEDTIPPSLVKRLVKLRLLIIRGDPAFAHELFLDAFGAEGVVRRAAGNAAQILQALQSPRHAERKVMILGAIDDETLLASVLPEISDPDLIEACLAGQCGAVAHAWAAARRAELFKRMAAEASRVTFNLSEDAFLGAAPDEGSLLPWTPQDRAFIGDTWSAGF